MKLDRRGFRHGERETVNLPFSTPLTIAFREEESEGRGGDRLQVDDVLACSRCKRPSRACQRALLRERAQPSTRQANTLVDELQAHRAHLKQVISDRNWSAPDALAR
jgi:hypothetical protein